MLHIECKKTDDRTIVALCGTLIGFLLFLIIYGVRVLNFTNDQWLYEGGDLSQHYIGWKYFRNTEWQWPIGITEHLSDVKTSVVFTDSIPLFAIIFKLFRSFLPHTFQYFGLWGLISYGLMGCFSARMIYGLTKDKYASIISSPFFVISPYVLQRMFNHTSLGGQWLIVVSLSVYLNGKNDSFKRKLLHWSIILSLATMVHIYFIPMVAGFIFIDVVRSISKEKIYYIFIFIVPIVLSLLELGILGAFSTMGNPEAEGLGIYSANLNTFLNPINSSSVYLRELGCGIKQYEGYGYLGIGIWLLVLLDIIIVIHHRALKKYITKSNILLGALMVVFFIIAISPMVTLGNTLIIEIPYPRILVKLLNIFRSTGRFIWPVCYLIFCVCITLFIRENAGNRKRRITILIFCLVLQMIDLSLVLVSLHERFYDFSDDYNISYDAWFVLLEGKTKVVYIPYDMVYSEFDQVYMIEQVASDEIEFNSFNICRPNQDKMEMYQKSYIKELDDVSGNEEYVYVFHNLDNALKEKYGLTYYMIDDCVVGVKNPICELDEYLVVKPQID